MKRTMIMAAMAVVFWASLAALGMLYGLPAAAIALIGCCATVLAVRQEIQAEREEMENGRKENASRRRYFRKNHR